jgi:formiminotetrahydrofolate cyclodeaminase
MTGGDDEEESFTTLPVGAFLHAMAAGTAAPAGGSAAALTLAQAAALCAKTARLSARQVTADQAAELTAEAERIRATAATLIDADALAYQAVIAQSHSAATARAAVLADPTAPGVADDLGHEVRELGAALSRAADVPMQIVELADPVARLTATLATMGNQALRGDAITAGLLALAAARSAALLVSINLADAPEDPRPARAAGLVNAISESVTRAFS